MTTVKEAVAARFQEMMKESNMRANELATRSGITPSSLYSMLDPRRKEVSVNLVKKICGGLDMTMGEVSARRCLTSWSRKKSNTTNCIVKFTGDRNLLCHQICSIK